MWVTYRIFVCSLIAALTTGLIAPAYSGEYHNHQTLNCSDCHISHASLNHDQNGVSANYTASPNSHLTKAATITELCLQCHDNQSGIPDVMGVDVNNSSERYDGTERAGGQFSEDNSDNWKGHNLPGQGAKSVGGCTACHDPHGNANYRNLKSLDGSGEGPVAYVNPAATGLERYRRSNIGYAKNIGDKLCMQCHDFGPAGSTGGTGGAHRHASSTQSIIAAIGATGGTTDVQHWIGGTGSGFGVGGQSVPRVPFAVRTATNFETATTITADNEVFCLSCHKAHGSVHAFGMQWPYGTSDGLTGSTGCNQCHNISGD